MKLDVSHAKFKAIEFFDRRETIFVDIFPLQTLHQTFLCAAKNAQHADIFIKHFTLRYLTLAQQFLFIQNISTINPSIIYLSLLGLIEHGVLQTMAPNVQLIIVYRSYT